MPSLYYAFSHIVIPNVDCNSFDSGVSFDSFGQGGAAAGAATGAAAGATTAACCIRYAFCQSQPLATAVAATFCCPRLGVELQVGVWR